MSIHHDQALHSPMFLTSTAFGVDPTLTIANMMHDDNTCSSLKNQKQFMLLNSSVLRITGKGPYPEIRPTIIKLCNKYNKSTELDLCKMTRAAQYIYGCKDIHQSILASKLLSLCFL
jgi:hypothetical protein